MATVTEEVSQKTIEICSECGDETRIISRDKYDKDLNESYTLHSCKNCGAEIEGITHLDGSFTSFYEK